MAFRRRVRKELSRRLDRNPVHVATCCYRVVLQVCIFKLKLKY